MENTNCKKYIQYRFIFILFHVHSIYESFNPNQLYLNRFFYWYECFLLMDRVWNVGGCGQYLYCF